MNTAGSFGGSSTEKFDYGSREGMMHLLASVRASEINPQDKNELRDLVLSYISGGMDTSVRLDLEHKVSAFGVKPIPKNMNRRAAVVQARPDAVGPYGNYRATPSFGLIPDTPAVPPVAPAEEEAEPQEPSAVQIGYGDAADEAIQGVVSDAETVSVHESEQPQQKETPQTPAEVSVPTQDQASVAAEQPAQPERRDEVQAESTAAVLETPQADSTLIAENQPAAAVATPSPKTEPPVKMPTPEVSATPNYDDPLQRIREIKSEVNARVGNPVNLVDIDNQVGREYMTALLEAMKSINSGTSVKPYMERLERAFAEVQRVVDGSAQQSLSSVVPDVVSVPKTTVSEQPPTEPRSQSVPAHLAPTTTLKDSLDRSQLDTKAAVLDHPESAATPPKVSPAPATPATPPISTEPVTKKTTPPAKVIPLKSVAELSAATPAAKNSEPPSVTPVVPPPPPTPAPRTTPQVAPVSLQEPVAKKGSDLPNTQPAPVAPTETAAHSQSVESEASGREASQEPRDAVRPEKHSVKPATQSSEQAGSPVSRPKPAPTPAPSAQSAVVEPERTFEQQPPREIPLTDKRVAQPTPESVPSTPARPVAESDIRVKRPDDLTPDPITTGEIDPLFAPEVSEGLNQLLTEWQIFKKSGMFGTGPKGIDHPLYKKLASLQIPLILAGRFDGSTQEIRQSITDYMNGWRYEQGIVYEQGETFEHYLRRVIRYILDLQNKLQGG